MPIDSLHPQYDSSKAEVCTNAFRGNVQDYIPRLNGQSNKEYAAYQNRATYFNVTKRTTAALIGAMLRKPYTTDVDTQALNVSGCDSFDDFLAETLQTIMLTGRCGLLSDFDQNIQQTTIVHYSNDNIINWRYEDDELILVVLKEDQYTIDPNDRYKSKLITSYRELYLEDGVYNVRVWNNDNHGGYQVTEEYTPNFRGTPFDRIPFVFINTNSTNAVSTEPLIYNLAQINISHFRTSADIEHAAHFTALPQPWLSGRLSNEEQELAIGTYDVWQLDEGGAVGYLEFAGAGIKSLQEISNKKEEQMTAVGSRLLQDKKGIESADALRIRQGSESASLIALIGAVESGITQTFNNLLLWSPSIEEIEFEMNKDLSASTLSAQDLKSLMEAYIQGTISQETFLQNLYDGEVVDDIEQERVRLANTD